MLTDGAVLLCIADAVLHHQPRACAGDSPRLPADARLTAKREY
jgi:hypothetical protein